MPLAIPPAAAIAIVAIVVAVLMFHRIGASDVCNANEAVEGVFVQQMVEHGKLLFPLENGSIPMYKPPLFHWSAAAIDYAAGIRKVTAANLRFPSALYATAGAILAMLFAYGILGIEGAILAGLVLAGSYQYVILGRFGRVDMTLCFFETLALFAFMRWLPRDSTALASRARVEGNVGALYLMALAMALGVLAKGPVGALLPGLSILIFMIVERRWRQIFAMLDPGAVILGVVLASSWYLACYVGGRYGFLDRQLGDENVGRFFGSLGAMSPVYYLKPILLNSAPFSLFIPVAAATALSPRLRRALFGELDAASDSAEASAVSTPRALTAVRLFAIFYFVTIVFFSLAAYKRRAYLLPVWPASAVMLAWWIRSMPSPPWRRIATLSFATLCAALAIFNFVYIPALEVASCRNDSYRPAAEEIARVVGADEPLYLYGFKEELAPLLFYLGRDAPMLTGRLGDAPPGYIIVPASVWKKREPEALDLEPVLTSDHGSRHLVVLKHGKSYASRSFP
ncbi:glycosyltransferase family 39 protein [Candidatus Binatus sp.]|uniref:ArnT family glycosyltransferase n=1 Tax=Candidatus Binatus sp. TaxID=2811406 RepID=UPI00272CE080|nr:phospholipid carrier-dependent glycosyltransferase [Candidatus Binatus sp.]